MDSSVIRDPYTIAKIWSAFVLLSSGILLLLVEKTYYSFDAFGVWLLSCIALLYLSRKSSGQLEDRHKILIVILGILICILSFLSIPLGISNPPYSIGEYSILLSGIGLVIFGMLGMRSLILPVLFPFIAVMGYSGYLLFLEYMDKLTEPLVPFTTGLSVTLLNGIGIPTVSQGNIISFLSVNGVPIRLAIIGECTGIISLGTFTIAVIIVVATFPQCINRKNLGLIAIGYLGTYAANICRIVLISLSGYYFGQKGVIEKVHVHIGWILFSLWMIVFWYYFFTRVLGISFFKRGGRQPDEKDAP